MLTAAENTSDFRRRANLRRSRRAHDRWRLVGRALQPRLAAGSYATLGFAPLAPLIREDFSLTRWQVGAITAIVFGGAAISSVPSGRLTDRFGAPPMLAAAVAAVACGCLLAAIAPGGLFFLLGVGAVGLAYGLITPPTNVIVRGAPTTRHRSLLMSVKQVGVTIGGFIAGVTMPTIAHHVGWRLALLAPAAACCGGGALGAAQPPHARAQCRRCAREPLRSGSQHGDLPRRFALGVGGFGFVMGGLQIAFVTYLSLYLKEEHGYRLAAAGISLAVTMAAGTAGRLLWAVISDRCFAARRAAGPAPQRAAQHGRHDGARAAAVGAADLAVRRARGLREHRLERRLHDARGRVGAERARSGACPGRSLRVVFAGAVVVPPLLGLVADRAGWTAAWLGACALAALAALSMSAAVLAQAREPRSTIV